MINYQTITIDLQPDYREPVVQMYLSESDVGRPIQVNVLMQGQPYNFIAGTTVHIDLRKPSGKTVQVDGNYAVGSNVVLFNVVKQMAAEPGMCLTELSIVGDGQDPIGSKNWLTKVELSPMHAGDPSETWIEDLDKLVQDAMEGHIDATLSIPGDAADAAAVGKKLADLKSAIILNDFRYMLSDCLKKMLWTVQDGAGLVDSVETALNIKSVTIGTAYIFTTFDGEYINKNNGKVLPDNTWCRTNYIPCKGVASIEFNGNGSIFTTARYGAFYTKNMEFIKNIPVTLNDSETSVSVTVPTNAEVFSISFNITQKDNLLSIIPR